MNLTRHYLRRGAGPWSPWRLSLTAVVVLALLVVSTRNLWLPQMGRSLVHDDAPAACDLVVVENYEPDYRAFEAAAGLLRSGYGRQLLIPLPAPREPEMPRAVQEGFVEVMTRIAGIECAQILPVIQEEPITLNVARQVAEALHEQGVRSVLIVSPRFRSRRTYEVYRRGCTPRNIQVTVVAAGGSRTPENWWTTTHGVQQVLLEFLKLHDYRLCVR